MKRAVAIYAVVLITAVSGFGAESVELGAEWYQKAVVYLKRGDLRRANQSFANALYNNPDHSGAQMGFDITLQQLEEHNGRNPPRKNPRRSSFRVSLGTAPGIGNLSDADAEPVSDEGGWQFEAMYVRTSWDSEDSNIGFLYGGGPFIAYNSGEDRYGEPYDGFTIGIMGQVGLAARLGDHVVVELAPYLGAGLILPSLHYGVKGGVHVLMDRGAIGLEVGYAGFDYGYETASGSGPRVAVVASFNF